MEKMCVSNCRLLSLLFFSLNYDFIKSSSRNCRYHTLESVYNNDITSDNHEISQCTQTFDHQFLLQGHWIKLK